MDTLRRWKVGAGGEVGAGGLVLVYSRDAYFSLYISCGTRRLLSSCITPGSQRTSAQRVRADVSSFVPADPLYRRVEAVGVWTTGLGELLDGPFGVLDRNHRTRLFVNGLPDHPVSTLDGPRCPGSR